MKRKGRAGSLRSREVLNHKYKEILKYRRTPRAAVHLMNIKVLARQLPKGAMEEFSVKVGRIKGLHPLARYALARLDAYLMARKGDFEKAMGLMSREGHVLHMAVTGPFGKPGSGGSAGLDEIYGPEKVDGFREDSVFVFDRGMVKWRFLPGADRSGRVRPSMMVRPLSGGAVYVVAGLEVKRDMDLAIRVGTLGGYKIWVGRTLVAEKGVERAVAPDQDAYIVRFPKGVHVVKVKLASDRGAWPLFMRVTAPNGSVARGAKWISEPARLERASAMMGPADGPGAGAMHGERVGRVVTVEGYLRAQITKRPKDKGLRKDLVRFLIARKPHDPRKQETRKAALELVRLDDSPANYRLLARAGPTRGERFKALEQALKKGPNDPDTLLVVARHFYEQGKLDDAEDYLKRCLKNRPGFIKARLLQAELLFARGLHVYSAKVLKKIQREVGWRQDLAQLLAESYRSSGKIREARKVLDELVKEDVANLGARRVLFQWAVDRLDLEAALEQLDALRKAQPYDTALVVEQANLMAANGRAAEARELILKSLKVSPDDTALLESLGNCHIILGDVDKAKKVWSRVLALRPQSQEIQQQLALLEETGPDPLVEKYALDAKEIITQDRQAVVESDREEWDALVLRDRVALKVLSNGMTHRFRHRIVKILTERGATEHGSWSVTYQPDVQRLRVVRAVVWRRDGSVEDATTEQEMNINDPSVRVYYDYKRRDIRFEKLRPGDVVELQTTLNDIADYSPFADYFGTILSLQEASPRLGAEVILEAPKKLRFHFNKPGIKGLQHSRKVEKTKQVLKWKMKDVPPYLSQTSMPGWGETASYLHVSTFRSWGDVAKWYWNLIREQYHADQEMKKKTAELTKGLTTDEEKVRALYGFVSRKIRYVSLSFGVHTHKPYSAPQVLMRRFGDCKDKAMLLSVMLGLVGVKAYPVLVRTRPGGRLGKYPASLAVFDHAVVYIPSLGRYLDGTAEFTGSHDLPYGNQGGDALIVDGGEGRYTRIPVLPSKQNQMRRKLEVTLAGDGSAVVGERIEITGQLASEWRYRFQEEGRRRELFEKALSRSFPGATIISLKMMGLEDPERSVEVVSRYKVPHLARRRDGEFSISFSRARGSLMQRFAPLSNRKHPVELDYPFISQGKIELTLPEGLTVKELPRDEQIKGAVSKEIDKKVHRSGEGVGGVLAFEQRVKQNGRVVTLERRLEIGAQRVPVKDYKQFRRFCSRVDVALRDPFVLRTGKSSLRENTQTRTTESAGTRTRTNATRTNAGVGTNAEAANAEAANAKPTNVELVAGENRTEITKQRKEIVKPKNAELVAGGAL